MDFFAQQQQARKQSRSLLWRFIVANAFLAAIFSGAVWLVVLNVQARSGHSSLSTAEADALFRALIVLDAVVFVTICLAALIKFRSLAAHGGAVAVSLGAERVSPETTDPLERRYMNVVEEMAIASGLPVPEVYILPEEKGINAFASGPTPEQSAVAVTRGALERLSRDELQGVVAHEFSHILHGDVRLNIRLAAYIYGLVIVQAIGRFTLDMLSDTRRSRSRRSDSKDSGGAVMLVIMLVALALMLFGFFGRLVSVLMSAAISREREYLADATAVQLTRNPTGIADALKKIGGYSEGGAVTARNMEGLSHFFLVRAHKPSFFSMLYSTHPPLDERIRRLDPQFDGEFPATDTIESQTGLEGEFVAAVSRLSQQPSPGVSATPAPQPATAAREQEATPSSFNYPIHEAWQPPPELHNDIVAVVTSECAICALLLNQEPQVRALQQAQLQDSFVPLQDVLRLEQRFSMLSLNQKLSVFFMALPTIQMGARSRRDSLLSIIDRLVLADNKVSLFEFLGTVLIHFASKEGDRLFTLRGSSSCSSLYACGDQVAVVISMFASCLCDEVEQAERLLSIATNALGFEFQLNKAAGHDVQLVVESFAQLRNTAPHLRWKMMKVLEAMATGDKQLTEREIAIMRLCSVLLRMPMQGL